MSRLLDTTVCPDCRAPLDARGTCLGCGLGLTGPLSVELRGALAHADVLVERLRAASTPASAPVAALPPLPAAPGRLTGPPPARRLTSLSVPWVLLSLGGLCLLVAAVVFVAVTWGALGLTGRTLVLGGLTLAVGAAAVAVTRHGLVAATEVLWVVVPVLVALDLLGARSAGLAGLDALGPRTAGSLVGSAVLVVALVAAAWVRTRPGRRVVGAEVVAVLGALVVVASAAWSGPVAALGSALSVPALAGAALLLARRVPVAAAGLATLAVLSWLDVLFTGVDRLGDPVTPVTWWAQGRGWPLVAAAGLAAVGAVAPRPRRGWVDVRPVAAVATLLPLAVLANGPVVDGRPARALLLLAASVVGLAAVCATGTTPAGTRRGAWSRGAAPLTALGVGVLATWLLAQPVDGLGDGAGLGLRGVPDPATAGLAPVVAVAVLVALGALTRLLRGQVRDRAVQVVLLLTPTVLGVGALVAVEGLTDAPLPRLLTGAAALALTAGATWGARDDLPGLAGAAGSAYLLLVVLVEASARSAVLAGVALGLALLLAVATSERQRHGARLTAGVLAGLGALLGALGLTAAAAALGWTDGATATLLAAYAGTLAVLARPAARVLAVRLALEGVGLLVTGLAVLAAAGAAPGSLETVLTVVGSAACLVAVTTTDRPGLGWAGAGVLGTATLLRVVGDVPVPELHTLPAAAVLVAAGLGRLRRDPTASSLDVLGSGVTLALLPSLLLALGEPTSLRGLLVGLGGLAALGLGVRLRLAAPFVLGAATVGVLALRHLEPLAADVPQWLPLGAAGLLLLLVGVTWESRRRDLARAGRYLVGLR